MERLSTIYLHRGATTVVEFDLTNFNFEGGTVKLYMKSLDNKVLKEFDLTSGVNKVMFTDEFTATLENYEYLYDIMWHVGLERFAQCLPSKIIVLDTVGGYHV